VRPPATHRRVKRSARVKLSCNLYSFNAPLRECADYGARQGVVIGLQNHADFIKTSEQVLRILKMVNSDWLAVNLDIGSFRIGDPYEEIAVDFHAARVDC